MAAVLGERAVCAAHERASVVKAKAAATPAVLVVLALGAFGYAYWGDRASVSDLDRAERKHAVLPSFTVDEAMRIEWEHGGSAFALERGGDDGGVQRPWFLTSPRHELADQAAVDMLLRELDLATRVRVAGETPLSGLDAPRVRGKVSIGGLEYRFALGADALRAEGGAYLRVDGEGTFVVGRSLKAQLLRGRDTYRERSLVSIGASDAERLEVHDAARGFVLERKGATFRLSGGLRASRGEVERLFTALADARAETFLDDADGGGLSGGMIVVKVVARDANRAPVELRLGGPCPGQPEDVVVTRVSPSPLAACTARSLVSSLGVEGSPLVDASPLYARQDEVEQVRIETLSGGASLDMARRGGGWHLRAPEDRDLTADESESANTLVRAMTNVRAIDVEPHTAAPAPAARFRATVTRSGDESTEVLELAAAEGGGPTILRRADDGAVLHLTRAAARRFEPHAVAVRSRVVPSLAFDVGSAVAIDDGCARVPQRLVRGDQGWAMLAPRGYAADALSIADLLGAFAGAKAEGWVDERDDGTYGLGGPGSCVVRITLREPGTRSIAVAFGAADSGDVYARVLDDPAVFLMTDLARNLASRFPIDRGPFRIDPSRMAEVSLAREKARVVFVRRGEQLVRQDGLTQDAGDADRLEAALAGFYPQAAVRLGAPAPDEGMKRPLLEITARGAADSGPREMRILVGAPTKVDGVEMVFVREAGTDATFVVPKRAVGALLDAW